MRQLFISDLHLCETKLQLDKLFHQFMQQQASATDELYVLGDLFDAWIGDDALQPWSEKIIEAFRQFSDAGGRLFFIRGNRDFLIGSDFEAATGGIILPQPYKLTIAGQQALIMHGDCLCTNDHNYIAFRSQSRSPEWQSNFLSHSIKERQQIALHIRDTSIARRRAAIGNTGDVVQNEVETLMEESEASLLIHGHTHRQARHDLTINAKPAERIVLGDWDKTGSVLIIENQQIELTNFILSD